MLIFILVLVLFAVIGRRAYRDAAEADRREALRGSQHGFPWEW